jgi:hypothetical protein
MGEHSGSIPLIPAGANVRVLVGEQAVAIGFQPGVIGGSEATQLFLLRQGQSARPVLFGRVLSGSFFTGALCFGFTLGLMCADAHDCISLVGARRFVALGWRAVTLAPVGAPLSGSPTLDALSVDVDHVGSAARTGTLLDTVS